VTHDHPGRLAAGPNWLTVAYPDGPRYDLGVLEALFLTAICAAFFLRARRGSRKQLPRSRAPAA